MTTKVCSKCEENKDVSFFSKKSATKDGLRSACKKCLSTDYKTYREQNQEKEKARHKKYGDENRKKLNERSKVWGANNKERVNERSKTWYANNRERKAATGVAHRLLKSVEINKKVKEWSLANPDKCRAKAARYRAKKLNATVSWSSCTAIEAKYTEALQMSVLTGVPHHVDHDHPLQGNLVCGFHVETNLVVLPGDENISKSNKFLPYREHGDRCQVFRPKYVLVPGWTADDPDHPYGYFI